MKKTCEKCRHELQPDGAAFICSHECTFCEKCKNEMQTICPNWGGELARRPKRKTS